MPKKPKVKLSKKTLKEKYPTKTSLDVGAMQFASRVFLVVGIFIIIALSVDIYNFTHWILAFIREGEKTCEERAVSPWPEAIKCPEGDSDFVTGGTAYAAE